MLAAFESVLSDIYESVVPSVVYVRVPNPARSALQGMQGVPEELLWGAGSGFVWDHEGHIVTNHHVVEGVVGRPEEVIVIFADSTKAKGKVVGGDPHSDLAVIKLEKGDWNLQPVNLGDSSEVKVGQLTVAIGAPFGQEFTMTSGIVSGVGRNISGQTQFTIPEAIQTDSAINPGNSGGPLIDRHGQVIGINTSIISRSGSFSGVGMAVPINIAKRVVPSLISDGEFNYPWLGVSIATVTDLYLDELGLPDNTRGALIIETVDSSPADKAGLRGSDSSVEIDGAPYPAGGDIILAIGPHAVTNSTDLIAHLTYHNSPGDTITLAVLRDGQREELEVTLGQRPATP
ncbi:Protease Do-like 1, chloroplastic [Geodia barretti]|uniref:Protease Do-like 1, chloroplastic n=1 Tax=Geodia barretti TaxID=519541 RepID=A0AA35TG25_GEOBA|nr:Protease Do-like 1, chloroplastic [Geodia barretti]